MKVTTTSPLNALPAILFAFLVFFAQSFAQENPRGPNRAMTDDELTKETEIENLRTINRALRKPDVSEKRVLGIIQKIDCESGIVFTIKTDGESFTLRSKDFASLQLNAFVPMSGESSVGCEADLSAVKAVISYKEVPAGRARGDLLAVEFVPNNFRILTSEEMNKSIAFDTDDKIIDGRERAAIIRQIDRELFRPEPGQEREVGYLEQIECTGQKSYFHIRTNEKNLKLFSSSTTAVKMRLFTRELEGMQFGCAMKPIDVPIVFIFKEGANAKDESDGEILTLEFVPRDFVFFIFLDRTEIDVKTARLLVSGSCFPRQRSIRRISFNIFVEPCLKV